MYHKKIIINIIIVLSALVVALCIIKIFEKDEMKQIKDQKVEEIVVNTYKSRVEVKTPKKVYKKAIPPEAKVIVSDKKSRNILKRITYKELMPKEQNKSIMIKQLGFYLQPKVCIIVSTDSSQIGGGIRYFWLGFYGLDFGVAGRNLYYGVDRRLGDVWYKLKNVTGGCVKTKGGFAVSVGVIF